MVCIPIVLVIVCMTAKTDELYSGALSPRLSFDENAANVFSLFLFIYFLLMFLTTCCAAQWRECICINVAVLTENKAQVSLPLSMYGSF